MTIEEIKQFKVQIDQIASKYQIKAVFVFGSAARGVAKESSDVDFLIELDSDASALGVGGFQFEVQQLLGVPIDVVPTFSLPYVADRDFVQSVQQDAVPV